MTKAEIKRIRELHRSKGRKIHKQYIIEGKRIFKEALESNEKVLNVFYTDSFDHAHSEFMSTVIKTFNNAQMVSAAEMRSISTTETPSGILGLCSMNGLNKRVQENDNGLYLDNISDPGNMGTLLRTAIWFGINNIILSENSVDVYNPKVVRSAMGAHFHILFNYSKLSAFSNTHTILGADQNGLSYSLNEIETPWVLVLGSEAHGIAENNKKMIDRFLAIPRIGTGESLNVAIAGGILMDTLSHKIQKP